MLRMLKWNIFKYRNGCSQFRLQNSDQDLATQMNTDPQSWLQLTEFGSGFIHSSKYGFMRIRIPNPGLQNLYQDSACECGIQNPPVYLLYIFKPIYKIIRSIAF